MASEDKQRFSDLQDQIDRRFGHANQLVAAEHLLFQALIKEKQDELDRRFAVSESMSVVRLSAVMDAIQALRKELELTARAQEEAVSAALQSAKEAVSKAETATEKRFEGVNEFRKQLADQATTFMPRGEAEIRLSQITEGLAEATRYIDRSGGSAVGKGEQIQEQRYAVEQRRLSAAQLTAVITTVVIAVSVLASTLVAVLHP